MLLLVSMVGQRRVSPLFPYTTLFRSEHNDPINAKILAVSEDKIEGFVREPFEEIALGSGVDVDVVTARIAAMLRAGTIRRSEEHTSELQSQSNLVCRLLLEKKNTQTD